MPENGGFADTMKELKLLHAADLHLDSAFESLSPEDAEARRTGQRDMLYRLADAAESLKADAVLLCGDVFNGIEVEHETARAFGRAMSALRCPVLIAPGNHDPYTPYSFWETANLPANVYVFTNANLECVELPGTRARFWGAGFQNAFCRPLLRDFTAPKKRGDMPDVMVLHGDVTQSESAYNAITRDDLVRCGMDYVALGHIHQRSPLRRAGEVSYAYPSCTEGRGYDETGEKGALFVTISDGGIETRFIPLGGVRYEIMTVDVGGRDPFRYVGNAIEGFTKNDCCRIILRGECEQPPNVTELRYRFAPLLRELQIHDETTEKMDVWARLGEDNLSGVFSGRLFTKYKEAKTAEEQHLIELAARYGLEAIENGGGPL